jgi:hypothetical protein
MPRKAKVPKPAPPGKISRSEWIRRLVQEGKPYAEIREMTGCSRPHYNSAIHHKTRAGRPSPRCPQCSGVITRFKKGVYFHAGTDVLAEQCEPPKGASEAS